MSRDAYFRLAAHAKSCKNVQAERDLAKSFTTNDVGPDGRIKYNDLKSFHKHVLCDLGMCLRKRSTDDVLPGGWHLFYIAYHVLLRVKTTGTKMRPRPHATLSLAVGRDGKTGLGWDDELAKFSIQADQSPKAFSRYVQTDWRMWRYFELAAQADEIWAESVHFDFPADFDVSGAATIHLP